MESLTTIFSRTRDMIGVKDIGLKSEQSCGDDTLGIGLIVALFH